MRLTSLIISAALLFAAAPLAVHAQAPCTLLTNAQVTAAMGTPMTSTPGPPVSCIWQAVNGDSRVYVTLRAAAAYATAKSQATAVGKLIPISGLGDGAFILGDSDTAGALYVLKGSHTVLILAHATGFTPDQTQAAEKTLATQAITHL